MDMGWEDDDPRWLRWFDERLREEEVEVEGADWRTRFACFDPVVMMRQFGMEPDGWQREMLYTQQNMLVNICRQAGKSTTAAGRAYHTAAMVPDSMIVLVSRALRQSGELFRKVTDVHQKLGLVGAKRRTQLTVEYDNGSRIVSLPGSEATVRGISAVDLLVMDEAARIPDDLYTAVRPMLAVSGGTLLALSTPFGERGWFWKAWVNNPNWAKIELHAVDCPRISKEFLEDERIELGPLGYAQEYECAFVQIHDALFRSEDIAAAFGDSPVEAVDFGMDVPMDRLNLITKDVVPLEL